MFQRWMRIDVNKHWRVYLVLGHKVLSYLPKVTVTSCFAYKVIRDLESIEYVCINPICRIGLIHKWSIDWLKLKWSVQVNIFLNDCKENTSLSLLAGRAEVSVYSYYEPTTEYCIMHVVVNTSSLPVYRKYRIASLLCFFEISVGPFSANISPGQ